MCVNGDPSHRSVVGLGAWLFVSANTYVVCMTSSVRYDTWISQLMTLLSADAPGFYGAPKLNSLQFFISRKS
jgi:hypothetical protein